MLIGLSGFWPGNNQPPGNIAPWRRPSSHHVLSRVSRSGDSMALRYLPPLPRSTRMSIRSLSTLKEDQPLVQIALTLKFFVPSQFPRAFREATGQTPAQYRRSVGMIAANRQQQMTTVEQPTRSRVRSVGVSTRSDAPSTMKKSEHDTRARSCNPTT